MTASSIAADVDSRRLRMKTSTVGDVWAKMSADFAGQG
jgi:hypothetical protein